MQPPVFTLQILDFFRKRINGLFFLPRFFGVRPSSWHFPRCRRQVVRRDEHNPPPLNNAPIVPVSLQAYASTRSLCLYSGIFSSPGLCRPFRILLFCFFDRFHNPAAFSKGPLLPSGSLRSPSLRVALCRSQVISPFINDKPFSVSFLLSYFHSPCPHSTLIYSRARVQTL